MVCGEVYADADVQAETSRHQSFLRWIAIHDSSPSLINQRKVALYGVRARETREDQNERAIRKEIRALFPELFGGQWRGSVCLCDCAVRLMLDLCAF